MHPIMWSPQDTPETIEQIKKHNAALCAIFLNKQFMLDNGTSVDCTPVEEWQDPNTNVEPAIIP